MTYPTPTIPPIGQEIEAKPQSVTASGGSDTPVSWTVRPLSGSQQSELDVETSGTDIPGVFAKLCWMFRRSQIYALSVKAGTHCGRFHFDGKYRGFNEHIESATKMLPGHPLFPTTRKPYSIADIPSDRVYVQRYEVYVEAEDDQDIAKILEIAGWRGLNVSSLAARRIMAPISGEYVIAEFRLGAELLLDVRHDQQPHLSDFKSRVALHLDRERIIKFWEPIPEDEPGERPWWKTENAAFGS